MDSRAAYKAMEDSDTDAIADMRELGSQLSSKKNKSFTVKTNHATTTDDLQMKVRVLSPKDTNTPTKE